MLTISQAMDRLKLREVKAGHVRDAASYRARRRNAARIVRRHLDGGPRLENLAYVAPPLIPPRTHRNRPSTEKIADKIVAAAFGRLTDRKMARS